MKILKSNFVWIAIALMILASILVITYKLKNSKLEVSGHNGIVETSRIYINKFQFVDPDSSVKIVYYYTHSCKFCEIMNQNLLQLVNEYPEEISISLNPIYYNENDLDFKKAKYTNCQLRNGKNKSNLKLLLGEKTLIVPVVEVSFNKTKIASCMSSKEIDEHIKNIKAQAEKIGIAGVPALIINNESYFAGLSFSELEAIVAREIETLGN